MRRSFLPILTLSLTLFTAPLWAQSKDSAMELGETPATAIETEAQVQSGLPQFLDGIQNSVDALKKNDWKSSKASLDKVRQSYDKVMSALLRISGDEERELGFQRIGQALDEANYALDIRRKKEALDNLTKAYRLSKTLADSPVLKLTATKVSLYYADQQIQGKNYGAAGGYLERAIQSLSSVEGQAGVDQKEISSLKNSIVIAHQQVILGQQKDEGYMKNLYQRATAATGNALYQYYDMWTRTPVPWDLN